MKEDGYSDVMAFMKTYLQMESVVEQYNREVWEYEQKLKQKEKPVARPPDKTARKEKHMAAAQTASGRGQTSDTKQKIL